MFLYLQRTYCIHSIVYLLLYKEMFVAAIEVQFV